MGRHEPSLGLTAPQGSSEEKEGWSWEHDWRSSQHAERKEFCVLGALTPAPPSPLTEASSWPKSRRSLADCSPRGGAAEKCHSGGVQGAPAYRQGRTSQKLGGPPQGPASWPSTGRGAQTDSHPTMRFSIFGSNYREYRKPQLSSLFVFPGQRHSPYRATAGTWVKYSLWRNTPTRRTAPHPQASLE